MRNTWREILVGVLILAAASLLAYMSIRVGSLRTPGGRTYVTYFDDAVGLVENAPVTASGIKIGSVDLMEYENGRARITVRLSPDVPIHTDATATIRARSLLGEKYLSINPGTSGTELPVKSEIRTTPSADIDRLLSAVATIAEAADPEDVQGLVHGLNELLNATSEDGKSLPEAVAEIAASVNRLTVKAERLADEGNRLSKKVGPALDDVQAATNQLSATLTKLDPAVEQLPESVEKLNTVLTQLEELLEKNEDLTKESLVDELRKIVTEEGVYVRLRPKK